MTCSAATHATALHTNIGFDRTRFGGHPGWVVGSVKTMGYGTAVWASHTNTGLPHPDTMQTGGNFVITYNNFVAWSTNTGGHPGAYICFQRDGNMVVYKSASYTCSGTVLWTSGT
jgi:hypothetical protein